MDFLLEWGEFLASLEEGPPHDWTVVVMEIYRMAAWKGYYLVDWKDESMENWKVGQMDYVL